MTAFYAVLRGYQTQGVFCEVVSRVLQMVFYKAYKGHNIAYFFWYSIGNSIRRCVKDGTRHKHKRKSCIIESIL